uniref:Phospholipid/glycerol acyltransferase domain-containing protein n=1 Tax=Wuchereria bancrofti TaxID=6293 RepID=A0A1I8EE52_WUCBA
MDVREIIALIGAFYWTIMTVFVVLGIIAATFLTVMLPVPCIRLACCFIANYSGICLLIFHKHSSVSWLGSMVNDHWSSAIQIAGINIVEYGDDILKLSEKRVLLLANHLGLADHFVIMHYETKKLFLKRCTSSVEKFKEIKFLKNVRLSFCYRSNYLGYIQYMENDTTGCDVMIHGNYFVDGDAAKRDQMIEDFKTHLKKNYWKYDHRWIIMYPEGARLYRIKESDARHAACEVLFRNHTSATVEVTNDSLEYVISFNSRSTLRHQNGDVPSIDMVTEERSLRIYRIRTEWKDENMLRHWLYDIYEKKELLEKNCQSGIFPMDSQHHPKIVRTSISNCLFAEAFWLLLLYFYYSI